MIKACQLTVDDFTDNTFRLLEIQGHLRRQRWRCLWLAPITFNVTWLILPDAWQGKLVFAGLSGALAAVFYMMMYKGSVRRSLRNWIVRSFGSDVPVPCEYELTPDDLVFRMPGQERRYAWRHLASVRRTPDAIEVETHPQDLLVLRTRLFANPDEMDAWHRSLLAHVEAGREPNGAPRALA